MEAVREEVEYMCHEKIKEPLRGRREQEGSERWGEQVESWRKMVWKCHNETYTLYANSNKFYKRSSCSEKVLRWHVTEYSCIPIFIATLATVANLQNDSRYLSEATRIKRMCCLFTIELLLSQKEERNDSISWRLIQLVIIRLSEISKTQKGIS